MRCTLVSAVFLLYLGLASGGCATDQEVMLDQRDMPSFLRGPHNQAFFFRHNPSFSTSAAIHFAHGKAHDVGELTPLSDAAREDAQADASYVAAIRKPPHAEPTME